MEKLIRKINLIWTVLFDKVIVLNKDGDTLNVNAVNTNKQEVQEFATLFFREAFLLNNN